MARKATRKQSKKASATADLMPMLEEIAGNVWWTWHPQAVTLFNHADEKGFEAAERNPVVMLRKLTKKRQEELAGDADFMRLAQRVHKELGKYLKARTWFAEKHGRTKGVTAYFCMEYALHESLPLYAGGLGVLAGDHLKSASDLGLPFVAVGIYWRKGYTRQSVDGKGVQQDAFPLLKLENTPLSEVTTRGGKPLRIEIPVGKDTITARAFCVEVGRVPLYLLDTDLSENKPKDRKLTEILYSGDRDTRIRQEILLGIGGWRLFKALGMNVSACHLNEGHAAFLSLERIAERMKDKGETYKAALQYVRNTSVFTTHTPVPAGNETFSPKLVDKYMSAYEEQLGLPHEQFHDLARVEPGNAKEEYGMTPLALHTAKYANGVAALHGEIARDMWKDVYPGKPAAKVPIGHVTNGIHLRTWLHPSMGRLYDELFGEGWEAKQDVASMWKRVSRVPAEELWYMHQQFKRELIIFCRERVARQLTRAGASKQKLAEVDDILDPEALTIGFARRFAPYKRATLAFRDADRFARLLNNTKRPVQIIFSGKAHPADDGGKKLIQELVKISRKPLFRKRVVFLEDYEMNVARHMVAGVDVWLNNPQRPREASGTSGMKPALHGGLNVSILDGWWPEGYNKVNGWAIGKGENYNGTDAHDERDAKSLYRVFEKEVVPCYFKRDANGVPTEWIERMRNAMATIPVQFNTHRQVKEYLKKYYLPAMTKA